MPTVDDVKNQMDALYASGKAYNMTLPFDLMRGEEIRATTLALAGSFASPARPERVRLTLDVGCGEGGIASFWPHKNIVGIDISQVAVEKARKAHPDVTYYAIPIERLCDVDEGPFPLVVAQESIEHWTEVPNSLKAIRAKMLVDGAFVLTTPNRDSLHCRMARKFGFEAPYCSTDHIHEFGYQELIDTVEAAGFKHVEARGVHLAPYWAIGQLGSQVRHLTDRDIEVNHWLNEIGRTCPEYAFIQCHRFEAV